MLSFIRALPPSLLAKMAASDMGDAAIAHGNHLFIDGTEYTLQVVEDWLEIGPGVDAVVAITYDADISFYLFPPHLITFQRIHRYDAAFAEARNRWEILCCRNNPST